MAIKLSEIAEALEMMNDDIRYVYDSANEDIVMLWDGMVNGEYNPELYEEISEGWNDNYIDLPDRYDVNEYGMMEDFIENLPEGRKKDRLENAIRGRGAFRRFKDTLYDLDLENRWYRYQEQRFTEIARKWCEDHHIPYEQ